MERKNFWLILLFYRNKNEALDGKQFAIFILKVVCDASSRLILFGAFMFTYNNWEFSPTMTVAYYYGIMTLMVLVNIWFCRKENERICSLRNMIGKVFWSQLQLQITLTNRTNFNSFVQELYLIVSCQSWVSTTGILASSWAKSVSMTSRPGCTGPSSGGSACTILS